MKKLLNLALLASFLLTVLVPLTGILLHKLASLVFLLLTVVHTVLYRKKLGKKRYLLLALVLACFVTGILGMLLAHHPWVLILHRTLSLAAIFFLAIHIFVYHRKL